MENKNSILEALSFDPGSGALTYKGVRYLLIRPETLTTFQKGMEERLDPEEAGEIMHQSGFEGGRLSAEKYRELFGLSDRETIDFMMRMGTEIGWGAFSVHAHDPAAGFLRIVVKDSIFAASYGASPKGVCHLIRGVVSGMSSVLFERPCEAREVKCTAMGDEACVFEVQTQTQTGKIRKGAI